MNTSVYEKKGNINRISGTKQNRQESWGGVIFLLVVLFPIGLLLLLRRLHRNYDITRRYGWILVLAGAAFLSVGIYTMLHAGSAAYFGSTALHAAITIPALRITIGILMVCAGMYYLKRDASDRRLIDLIEHEDILDPSDLSLLMTCSAAALRARINRLIKDGLLPGIRAVRQEKTTGTDSPAATRKPVPAVLLCACVTFCAAVSMLFPIGFSSSISTDKFAEVRVAIVLFYVGIIISLLLLAVYVHLSVRNSPPILRLEHDQ